MYYSHIWTELCHLWLRPGGIQYDKYQKQTHPPSARAQGSVGGSLPRNDSPGMAADLYHMLLYPVLLARTFLHFFSRIPKYGFGHETDLQKCYGHKNTGKFGISAIRIQWTTSRTKIRPKSRKNLNFILPTRARPGGGKQLIPCYGESRGS